MKKDSKKEKPSDDLRSRAEERVGKIIGSEAEFLAKDPVALLHELEVHQIELEMQNEELRYSQEELAELSARYQDLYDFAPVGYLTLDRELRIVRLNLAGATLIGMPKGDIVGRHLVEFISLESRREVTEHLRRCLDGMEAIRCEARLACLGKDVKWVLIDGVSSENPAGRAEELRLTFTDIGERKEVEEALRVTEEKFSRIFQVAPVIIGIITMDEGRFIDINNYSTQTLRYQPNEIIGRTADELGIWEDPEVPVKLKGIMEDQGFVRNTEVRLRARNEEVLTALLSADFVEINGVRHMLIVLRDITERKRAEEEIRRLNLSLEEKAAKLDEANRELDAFNYAVAHDLLNHMNTVGCYCQLVKQTGGDKMGRECLDYVEAMSNSLLKMENFIEAMLTFSRLSHGGLNRKDFNLSAVAQEIALGLKCLTPSRTIELQIAEGVRANGEPILLRVVMENLLGNAFKFTDKKEPAVIKFGVTEKEGETVYFVSDNGTGFDISQADNIFIPFHRLHGATEHRGHGIGLATVERIVRRHGGRIWAEGKPGVGATFFFTLPEKGDLP